MKESPLSLFLQERCAEFARQGVPEVNYRALNGIAQSYLRGPISQRDVSRALGLAYALGKETKE